MKKSPAEGIDSDARAAAIGEAARLVKNLPVSYTQYLTSLKSTAAAATVGVEIRSPLDAIHQVVVSNQLKYCEIPELQDLAQNIRNALDQPETPNAKQIIEGAIKSLPESQYGDLFRFMFRELIEETLGDENHDDALERFEKLAAACNGSSANMRQFVLAMDLILHWLGSVPRAADFVSDFSRGDGNIPLNTQLSPVLERYRQETSAAGIFGERYTDVTELLSAYDEVFSQARQSPPDLPNEDEYA